MKKNKVRWGVISCAGIAKKNTIPAMLQADNAELYAISGKTPEKLAQFREMFNPIKTYDDYEAMLQDPEIDAVYIPLPNSLHFPWAVKAAEHKKHVLCEKPLAISADQVRQLKKVFDKNGVLLMEAFASRHNPLLVKVKEMLDEGVIGKIRYIETRFCFNLKDRTNVRWIKELGGGATYDLGAYTIGTIRYLVGGEPIQIHAVGDVDAASGVDGGSVTTMAFGNGVLATSYCSFNSYLGMGYTIRGDEGVLEAPVDYNGKGELAFTVKRDDSEETITMDIPDNYRLEIEQFGRCILEGEAPLVTNEYSLGNAEVIDAVLTSVCSRGILPT